MTGVEGTDLVLVPGFVSHLEIDWDDPRSAGFLERLGAFSRLIRFDKRGTGLSDRPGGAPPGLETRMDDVRAVMDALGSERAALFGYSDGGPMAIAFAATYPERTTALILYGSFAKRIRSDDYPWAPTLAERRAHAEEVEREWGLVADMHRMCPSADDAMARWWEARARAAASPGAARALIELNSRIDVREILPAIRVPTLVLHRRGDRDSSVEEGRYMAERIPDARFVELTGSDHVPWIDHDEVVDEVEEFLTGVRPPPRQHRVLATVLFTDIVGSTEVASRIGDRAWADLLDAHHAAVRGELARHAGEEIDTAGDGFLALFDGPARAISCALAIQERVSELGLSIRAGLHTGEVERRGRAARGIAVHIAARVAAAAGPGEVLATETTRDLVAGAGIDLSDRGLRPLEGVGESKRLFAAAVGNA